MGRPAAPLGLVALALLAVGARGTAQGALKLDNYTLDKLRAVPGHSLLVKFDESYPYGDQEDEFKELCKLAYSVPRFFVGEVPVQTGGGPGGEMGEDEDYMGEDSEEDSGEKENDDLRERFQISKDDFPAYFLFDEAHKDGLRYDGAVTVDDLSGWLRRYGVKMPTVGTIEELDDLARRFLKEGLADAHLAAAKELSAGSYSTDRKAPMYVKIMEKIKAKGEAYVAGEAARVQKLVDGKLTEEKKAELSDKLKILTVFASAKDEL